MSKKYTVEEVKRISIELGTEFYGEEYHHSHVKYDFKCVMCGQKVGKTFNDVLHGHLMCLKCSSSIGQNKMTLEQVKEKSRSVDCEFLDDEYHGNKYKHNFLCAKCKTNTFSRSLNDVLKKDKPRVMCDKCAIKSRVEKRKLTKEKFEEYKSYYHNNCFIDILSEYKEYRGFANKSLLCHCLICNNKKYMSLQQLRDIESQMGCGCSYISYGERITLEFLEHNGIEYEFQKVLQNGLYSDFEIKLASNKVLLLEIDGSQHYIYQPYFHKSYDDFLNNQNNDKLKENLYINNGDFVQRIKYENSHGVKGFKNDDIMKILNDILQGKFGAVKLKEKNLEYNIIDIARIHTMGKKILVYTLDGKFFKEYNSLRECSDELKINNMSKPQSSSVKCGDYMIRNYIDNYPLKIEPYEGRFKRVKVYKNGLLLGIFGSIREVSKETGINRTSISDYLKGQKTKISKEYHFEYSLSNKAS